MYKAKRITIKQLLNKIHKGKRILCFGAGGRLNEFIAGYAKENLEQYIEYIFDNNEKIWDSCKEINGIRIPIVNPLRLREIYSDKYIVLITMSHSQEVIEQIINCIGKKIVCYDTPVIGTWTSGPIEIYIKVIDWISKHLPLKNIMVFGGWGNSQRENEATLRDYFIENGYSKKYKIVWLSDTVVDEVEKVKNGYYVLNRTMMETYNTLSEVWYRYNVMNRAKYLFFENHTMRKARKGQKCIYLNHGVPPIKQTKHTIKLPEDTDVCVCSSSRISHIVSEQYNINKDKLLYSGSPRFDHLFLEERYIDKFICGKEFCKVVVWVPTFRQHNIQLSRKDSDRVYACGVPFIEKASDFDIINQRLEELNVCLMIKPHPLQDLSYIKVNKMTNIVLLLQEDLDKEGIGVNCVIKDADAMITDYSTIAFDYMLLDKPIGYTIDDMEEYNVGFSTDSPLDWMPGRHMKNMDDMLGFIADVCDGVDEKREDRNKVRDIVHENKGRGNSEELVWKLGL